MQKKKPEFKRRIVLQRRHPASLALKLAPKLAYRSSGWVNTGQCASTNHQCSTSSLLHTQNAPTYQTFKLFSVFAASLSWLNDTLTAAFIS